MRAQKAHFAVPLGSRPQEPSGHFCCDLSPQSFETVAQRLRAPLSRFV